VSLQLSLFARLGRLFVEKQRERALAAPAMHGIAAIQGENVRLHFVRILAFSTCKQSHQLQAPALQREKQIHGKHVTVVEVDAVDAPERVQREHVLTVPTIEILETS